MLNEIFPLSKVDFLSFVLATMLDRDEEEADYTDNELFIGDEFDEDDDPDDMEMDTFDDLEDF